MLLYNTRPIMHVVVMVFMVTIIVCTSNSPEKKRKAEELTKDLEGLSLNERMDVSFSESSLHSGPIVKRTRLRNAHEKTELETECYDNILLVFEGQKDTLSCIEFGLFKLTSSMEKIKTNYFAQNYYYYLLTVVNNGNVKSPEKFCSSDTDRNLLESIYGKHVEDAIRNAYLNELMITKDGVEFQYMDHIINECGYNSNIIPMY